MPPRRPVAETASHPIPPGARLQSAHVPPFGGDPQAVVVTFEVPRSAIGK
jgi:hypothetical protein